MPNTASSADFVGTFACKSCHEQAFKDWQGSDHDMAMKHADEQSVFGDFNQITINHQNQQYRFFKKQESYWVNLADRQGKLTDYQISFTFGYYPLQQYMVEFEDGRVQLIPFAWDNRKVEDGGQKWFYLYPNNSAQHQDFYWLNAGQNWNHMCADCHSTNVKKNYNPQTNRFDTQFSEINVGCEACHGAASDHLSWANDSPSKNANNEGASSALVIAETPFKGFDRTLAKSVAQWQRSNLGSARSSSENTAKPLAKQDSQQLQTCAQCHSRRLQLNDKEPLVTKPFGDRYQLNLIAQAQYFDDGQVYDENYVYGSFLQSKMHENSVVCSNCHNPHTTELILQENSLCSQCHEPGTFDTSEHHKHDNNTGSLCVNCHMPETTYMQIDDRRDHSFSIPVPANTQRLGSPNACNQCHDDKSTQWAIEHSTSWYPELNTFVPQHFSSAFASARAGNPNSVDALSYLSQDHQQANIIRAAAIERLQQFTGRNGIVAIARAVKHQDEMLRVAAVEGSSPYTIAERWQMLAPLLTDEVLMIRSQAAAALANYWQQLSSQQQAQLEAPLKEYIEILSFNADRGFARTNLGNLYANQGFANKAEASYKASIDVQPNFAGAYTNLADLYRSQGKESAAVQILEQGIIAKPDSGTLRFSQALALLRSKQNDAALKSLKMATKLEPNNGRFWYVYAIALTPYSIGEAATAFNKAYQVSGNPQYLFALCELMIDNRSPQSLQCLNKLTPLVPNNVVEDLRARLPK
ncbi:tetratricopeptide repeat protein [Shewanella marinintestina]|uniref:multiheme c-type cytochrome n=1 Tax=Shewanella marinintestina TaxID=190305 RepID=UPI00200C58D9|nr:multiheme c-type cytochrome [Shewanella marinintestina]MCL1145917.1 tetratricopeptide repeat protein [Shewanella marinintestina]